MWTDAAIKHGDDIFYPVIAILRANSYKEAHSASLTMDWARIPIRAAARPLAALGRRLVELFLVSRAVPKITTGQLRSELENIAIPSRVDGKQIDPHTDLDVSASWGFRNTAGAVVCGQGEVLPNKIHPDAAVDIYINDVVCRRNVPREVWGMAIGGYPVVKKLKRGQSSGVYDQGAQPLNTGHR